MRNKNNNHLDDLKREMNRLGAREFEIVALSMDAARGLAALTVAQNKGADNPIAYAIKIFDNPDWNPAGESRRVATNITVDVKCETCDGLRFIAVLDDWSTLYGETYKPCPDCNASLDTGFWRADGSRFVVAS